MKHFRCFLISISVLINILLFSFVWGSFQSVISAKNIIQSQNEDQSEGTDKNVNPEAVKILRRSMDYLSSLNLFSVQGQSTYEDILSTGQRVDYEMSGSVTVSRPNKLRAENIGSNFSQIFYYDGESLSLYNPNKKVYATEQAPGTIDELLYFAQDSLQMHLQFADLLYSNAFQLLTEDLTYATVIGKELIGEIQCDHLLFSKPGVDFQIWIDDITNPLPYKLVITDTATPELLSFSTVLGDWNLNPEITGNTFYFTPPKGTKKIMFLKAEATPLSGNKNLKEK